MSRRHRRFHDPGGASALHPASRRAPRCFPCPTCREPDRLTRRDVDSGYQCDECARRDEGFF